MKKVFLFLILLMAVFSSRSQSFEGTITWSLKMDISDPATKAKMAAAQQKMNDPATQAKMKEMQAKMNDPQFKAMMESNPQMKAQMENVMKITQGGGDMSSMVPKSMTLKIKDSNSLMIMDGGIMPMEILHLKDKDESVRLDRPNKTYSILPQGSKGQGTTEGGAKPTVTKTTETAKILNYTCTKYIVQMNEGGRTMKENIWTTTDIKDIDMKSFSKHSMNRGQQQMYFDGMEGVPLKTEVNSPEGNIVMEVTSIKKESLSAADFAIPADFKEVKMFGGR